MIADQVDVEFEKDGDIFDHKQVDTLVGKLGALTDLLVISHGWNNDRKEATRLYDDFAKSVEQVVGADAVPAAKQRRLGVLRVFWPSKKFADKDLIPGGGAASRTRESDESLVRLLDELANDPVRLGKSDANPARSPHVERAKKLLQKLDSPDAQREFVQCLRAILDPDQAHADDASSLFFSEEPTELFARFSEAVPVPVAVARGGGTALGDGGAAGFLGDLIDGIKAGARRIANFATYYQMKSRAGHVGKAGLGVVLARVREKAPTLPIHLVGHSFGGRVVTAAATTLPPNGPGVTMTLLQAAFSHNGFATKFDGKHDGAFRSVLADRRIAGPLVVTHTKNDKAVGVAYPLASRIANTQASALGDENDPYGGIGRNGAQRTDGVSKTETTLRDVGTPYALARGQVFNLRADDFIKDHSDVTGHQVAYAFLNAMTVA